MRIACVFTLHISTQEISEEGNSLLFIYYLQNSNSNYSNVVSYFERDSGTKWGGGTNDTDCYALPFTSHLV